MVSAKLVVAIDRFAINPRRPSVGLSRWIVQFVAVYFAVLQLVQNHVAVICSRLVANFLSVLVKVKLRKCDLPVTGRTTWLMGIDNFIEGKETKVDK